MSEIVSIYEIVLIRSINQLPEASRAGAINKNWQKFKVEKWFEEDFEDDDQVDRTVKVEATKAAGEESL